LLLFSTAVQLNAQVGLLYFIDDAPEDETVTCHGTLGPSPALRAARILDGGVIDTIFLGPVDSLSAPDAICTGGINYRIWEESGPVNTIRMVQEQAFGPATAGSGPLFFEEALPPARTVVDCRIVNDNGSTDGYLAWLTALRVSTSIAAFSSCTDIVSITDDAPGSVSGLSCQDSVVVMVTATDFCDRTAMTVFTYVTIDTAAPVITGVIDSTFAVDCSEEVPPAPVVTVSDCDDTVELEFAETTTQVNDGSCGQYNYDVERTWMAMDRCGNAALVRHLFEVRDDEVPDFARPTNRNLACTQDPFDLELTGRPTDLTDNCTPVDELVVSYVDEIVGTGGCEDRFDVQRTWTVTDICGNSRSRQQRIRVQDELPPIFSPPAEEVTVSCTDFENTAITGEPTDLADICDPTVNLFFEDTVVESGGCSGNFTVDRRWRIFDDCGNSRFFTQRINVIDTIAPAFVTEPADLVTSCNTDRRQEAIFSNWLNDLGGAVARDNCTPTDSLTITIVESGTDEYPTLPRITCMGTDGTIRQISVDIVVSDFCGNTSRATMEYRQVDDQPINIFDCLENQVIATDVGECEASFLLEPPTIQDQCNDGRPLQLNLRDTTMLTSAAANEAELGSTPVDPLTFTLPIPDNELVNGESPGTLTITLETVDAEGEDEFFFVFAEDGTLLGTTERGEAQCETVVTTLTIPPFDFSRWARDGEVTFRLEPNIPDGQQGTFAINNLCAGGSRALVHLRMPVRRIFGIFYEVNIDDGGFVETTPTAPLAVNFATGLHRITYRATDCGGFTDECTFTITVEDQEAPVITCPADMEVFLAPDSCQATTTLPLPLSVVDNCEPYTVSNEVIPGGDQLLLFPFQFDPNLNTFQARSVFATLSQIPGNLTDSVDIEVTYFGMFGNPRAILDIVLPDGTIAASSRRGDAGCGNAGLLRLRLAASDFTAQVNAAGRLPLELRPRTVTVPPGLEGDGVTPCNEDDIFEDGGDDGQSGLSLRVTYRTFFPNFSTDGATVTPLSSTSTARPDVIVTFNQGETIFSYVVSDPGGNSDACTFSVMVRDTTPPSLTCTPTTVFVDPSGLSPATITPDMVGDTRADNCGMDSLTLRTTDFGCSLYGQTVDVVLVGFDETGNSDSCTTFLSVAPLEPLPTSSTSLCGGDTLRLFANPPTEAAPGQTIYTYQWFNPAGAMISTRKDPVLAGIDMSANGAYRVVIRGLTGCESEGVVNVSVGTTPPAAAIVAPQRVCEGEPAVLTSNSSYAGDVRYEWYRGQPGGGTLVGESTVATFNAPFGEGEDGGSFYAIAYVNGCIAPPSNVVAVGTAERPVVSVTEAVNTACELGDVVLTAEGPGNLIYEWSGPNDFLATGREITLTNLQIEQAGSYTVRGVLAGGCFSEPATTRLFVIFASEPTTLDAVPTLCPSDTLLLRANTSDDATFFFSGPNGLAFETTDSVLRIAPPLTMAEGEWVVQVQRGTCPSEPSPAITVNLGQSPTATATTIPSPVCEGNDLILQGASNSAGSTYRWVGPNGLDVAGIAVSISDVDQAAVGDYELTVTSPAGCVSRDTVAVEVLPGILIDSVSVSSGECLTGGEPVFLTASVTPVPPEGYTYQWNGPEGTSSNDTLFIPNVSLASNGVYTVTVINEAGCRSPQFRIPVEFDFAPAAPAAPFDASGLTMVCEGDSLNLMTNDFGPGTTYLWRLGDGTNLPTNTNSLSLSDLSGDLSGAFSVRVIRNGCTSRPSEVQIFTITDYPSVSASANDPACTGQAINFVATDLPSFVYAWRGPNNFSSSLSSPTIVSADAGVHAGTYSLMVSQNGCVADSIFLDVEVKRTPGVPVLQPADPICIADPNAELLLQVNPNTATEGATYSYFIDNGQIDVATEIEGLSYEVNDFSLFTGGGLFEFRVGSNLDGCSSALSNPVSIRLDAPGATAPDAGRDTVICSGSYVLTAAPTGVGTGEWRLVSGTGDIEIMNPESRTTPVTGLSEFGGPYEFAWTLSSGSCTDYAADTVRLTISDGEEADAGENVIVCVREEARLGAVPTTLNGSGGTWTQALAQELLGVIIVAPNDPNTVLSGIQADNTYSFTWTVTSNCGVKTDVVLVSVSDPTPFAGDDEVVCKGDRTTILAADEPTLGSTGRWTNIGNEATIDEPTSPTTMVSGLLGGSNLFVWEVDEGFCGDRSRDTVVINYLEPPVARNDDYVLDFQGNFVFDPTENDEMADGAEVNFTELPAGSEVIDNGDGTFTFRAPPNFVGEVEVRYEISNEGCAASLGLIYFLIGEDAACVPPNIFTPNGDGMNDMFVVPCLIDGSRFPDSQVTIYNQWGDEVYRSGKPYTSDWDGTFQGNQLPVATYFYTIDFGGSREGMSGAVRIER